MNVCVTQMMNDAVNSIIICVTTSVAYVTIHRWLTRYISKAFAVYIYEWAIAVCKLKLINHQQFQFRCLSQLGEAMYVSRSRYVVIISTLAPWFNISNDISNIAGIVLESTRYCFIRDGITNREIHPSVRALLRLHLQNLPFRITGSKRGCKLVPNAGTFSEISFSGSYH